MDDRKKQINIPSYVQFGQRRPGGGFGRMAPVEKPKDFKRTMIRLWKYVGNERKILMIILLFILIDGVVTFSVPYIIGHSIDAISSSLGVDFKLLSAFVTVLIAMYITSALVNFIQGWLMAGLSQRIVKNLRRSLFGKLQKLPVSFFDMKSHGDIMSRLTNDIENVSTTISQSTLQLIGGVLTLTGSLTMMIVLNPILTAATLVTVPLVFLLTRIIAKKTSVLFREQQAVLGKLNGHIEENISGIHVVKAFSHEEKSIRQFDEINSRLCDVGLKAQIWSGYIMPLMNVINNFGFAVVAGCGGLLAVKGMITVGVIASFLGYSRQFARPLNDLANIFNNLQSAVAGSERVFEVLDEIEETDDAMTAMELTDTKGDVVLEDVNFSYREDVMVLKNVGFEVKAGDNIALVGPTGAGKTTIVNLLNRFYDVTSGKIMIDGKDIREYTRESLRKNFGIVLQDTYLFTGTIMENIKYGKLDASDIEAINASKMSNADVFIRHLPDGYETILAECGNNLSQGQKQLIAIARAILSDPAILILDEATSNVDTRTELHIREAMLNLMKNRTCFVIAHRLSTIKDADMILVIDNGTIIEKGDHKTLIELDGLYSKMYDNQYKNIRTEFE